MARLPAFQRCAPLVCLSVYLYVCLLVGRPFRPSQAVRRGSLPLPANHASVSSAVSVLCLSETIVQSSSRCHTSILSGLPFVAGSA
jgi:hypothetical protein